jgi:hypothetical protein
LRSTRTSSTMLLETSTFVTLNQYRTFIPCSKQCYAEFELEWCEAVNNPTQRVDSRQPAASPYRRFLQVKQAMHLQVFASHDKSIIGAILRSTKIALPQLI